MIAIPCIPPGELCALRGGVFVRTVTERQRIACGWYRTETIRPEEKASPTMSYGPLSQITYISMAVIRPSLENPTFIRPSRLGRPRPM